MNRIWNYICKGFLGTILIVFLFPLICIAASLGSLVLAIATPFWVPIATVILHIYMMFVYDLDAPDSSENRYCIILETLVWNILIQGCLQPIVAVFVAAVFCPIASIVICLGNYDCVFITCSKLIYSLPCTVGLGRYWLRLLWDSLTFHLFIKKCGRVPASDSLAVKRIAGPGLALDYFFNIKPEQALAAFEAKMELEELQAYQQSMESIILQPQKDFSQFVEACFGPFSAQLSKTGPYRLLEREGKELMTSLHEKLEKRRQDLQIGLTTVVKSKIKLNTMELKVIQILFDHLENIANLLWYFFCRLPCNKVPIC